MFWSDVESDLAAKGHAFERPLSWSWVLKWQSFMPIYSSDCNQSLQKGKLSQMMSSFEEPKWKRLQERQYLDRQGVVLSSTIRWQKQQRRIMLHPRINTGWAVEVLVQHGAIHQKCERQWAFKKKKTLEQLKEAMKTKNGLYEFVLPWVEDIEYFGMLGILFNEPTAAKIVAI